MNALDFFAAPTNSSPAAEAEFFSLHPAPRKSAEPFDALMHRAMSQPRADSSDIVPARTSPPNDLQTNSPTSLPNRSANAPKNDSRVDSKPKPEARPAAAPAKNADATSDAKVATDKTDDSDDSADAKNSSQNNHSKKQEASTSSDAANVTILPVAATVVPIAIPETNAVAAISANAAAGVAPANADGVGGSTTAEAEAGGAENGKEISKQISKLGAGKPEATGKKIPGSSEHPAKNSGSADGAVAVNKLLAKVELTKETAVNTGISASSKIQAAAPEASGISSAQQAATMKNADTAEKISGQPEQNSPDETSVAPGVEVSAKFKAASAISGTAAESAVSPASSPSHVSSAAAPSDSAISAASQTDLRTRALDRTHDIVALHAMRMKDAAMDSLHVVIKPGAGLQLSLQLKQNGNAIEAQAVLNRGDFNQLNQHWSELQQRLEERGIKLAPLSSGESSSSLGSNNFQNSNRHPSDAREALATGAFAEFALAGAVAEKSAQRTVASAANPNRGWETWA